MTVNVESSKFKSNIAFVRPVPDSPSMMQVGNRFVKSKEGVMVKELTVVDGKSVLKLALAYSNSYRLYCKVNKKMKIKLQL